MEASYQTHHHLLLHQHAPSDSQQEEQERLQSSLLFDALYCSEEHWEEEDEEEELASDGLLSGERDHRLLSPRTLLDQDLLWEDEELASLFSKEEPNGAGSNLESDPALADARREAVEWMMRVHAHYAFSALTALLAVNYWDRFMCSFPLQEEKPWMTQLSAVACLSLAAKVEETQVPLLIDFQVDDSSPVFEAKNIQKMELLVLSSLKWKMNPVTPLSFLDYMTRRLGLTGHLCWEFLRRCEHVLLSVISDCRLTCFLPSVIAASTMLHVINGLKPRLGVEDQTQLLGILGMGMDKIDACYKLIDDRASRGQNYPHNKRKFGSVPGSPRGVMEMCFSSDSSNDSWAVAAAASVSSSPEPHAKKSRAGEEEAEDHASADIFSFPH
ncbi:cyclin-D3-1-like isoform X2 [Rhodamnia argentea]|nr:cyclin-D3-1-like isoform X2 [Rhodamnia argentea]